MFYQLKKEGGKLFLYPQTGLIQPVEYILRGKDSIVSTPRGYALLNGTLAYLPFLKGEKKVRVSVAGLELLLDVSKIRWMEPGVEVEMEGIKISPNATFEDSCAVLPSPFVDIDVNDVFALCRKGAVIFWDGEWMIFDGKHIISKSGRRFAVKQIQKHALLTNEGWFGPR